MVGTFLPPSAHGPGLSGSQEPRAFLCLVARSSGPDKDVEPAPGVSGPGCLRLRLALGKSLWEATWVWKQGCTCYLSSVL
ncbi:Hypothetical predicted protein [Lynx pardinus]|uniref:Uncharacterized protein n=1 Tax=Lynx pardinus TaxID=191816 RepID=A0A485N8I7_LYNPA|nr:Hypothetical predicted protein [Lynx pardinus]